MTVGTGIGGGIVVEDRLYRGRFGIGGEIGHMQVVADGRLCGCGQRGCWEQYASGNALVREARERAAESRSEAAVLLRMGDGTPEMITGRHVTEAARLGDEVALAAFATVGRWLGQGLADLVAVLDPGRFIIGGGVSEAGDLVLRARARGLRAPDHGARRPAGRAGGARRARQRRRTGRGSRPGAPDLDPGQVWAQVFRGSAEEVCGDCSDLPECRALCVAVLVLSGQVD